MVRSNEVMVHHLPVVCQVCTQVSGEYETTQPKRDQLLERQLKRRPGSGVENETSKRDLLIHRNQYNRAEHVT